MNSDAPELRICGISTLSATIREFQPDLIISITDPFSDVAEEAAGVIYDHEVSSVALHYHDAYYRYAGAERVSFEMFDAVIDALDKYAVGTAPKILVHCHAGQQRSPAMAAFALGHIAARSSNLNDAQAAEIIEAIYKAAPHCEPDQLTLEMGGDVLGDPGLFVGPLRARRIKPRRTAKDLRGKKRKRAFRV